MFFLQHTRFGFHINRECPIGPIIRINPWEVHIDDPQFYDNIYTSREGYNKPDFLKWRFLSPHALFSTSDHTLHRLRRSSQDPFFAKGRIHRLAPRIQALADTMSWRIRNDYSGKRKPLILNNLFISYIADVTTQYSFNRDFKYLEDPNFQSTFIRAITGFKELAPACAQFPWLGWLLDKLPDPLVRCLKPSMRSVQDLQKVLRVLCAEAQEDINQGKAATLDSTAIHGILRSNLPGMELGVGRLKDQAAGLISAAVASAHWTLSIACYHIISDKHIWKRLRTELEDAIPEASHPASLTELESLPYLNACIYEGPLSTLTCTCTPLTMTLALRLSCGQMTRSPRISRSPITYSKYTLPPGTLISLDTWHMHHNESLYPQSFTYSPERWLSKPQAPDGNSLKHYMVAFGKGTRNCLGQNLATAAIFIGLAAMIRNFEFEVFETTYERDIQVLRDLVAPDVHPDSVGVRVLVN
jgi:cytochrome P450